MWRTVVMLALLTSAGARADECRENTDCTRPWSSCWMLGWCAAGRCLYQPLTCAAGSGCGRAGSCGAAPFTLNASDDHGRFRLSLTNTSGAPARVTVDPHRVILGDIDCTPEPPAALVAPAQPSASPPRKLVADGERVALVVDLAWIVEPPEAAPLLMHYNVAKGSSCKATFLYRLDDGMLLAAPPLSFKR